MSHDLLCKLKFILNNVIENHCSFEIFVAVVEKVNESIAKPEKGRLFAVVYITAKQYKVTDNDLIKAAGRIVGVKTGDRIKLEKVSCEEFLGCKLFHLSSLDLKVFYNFFWALINLNSAYVLIIFCTNLNFFQALTRYKFNITVFYLVLEHCYMS